MSERRLSETASDDVQPALYQALVVQRARTPVHAGVLVPADGTAEGNNPLCGDRVSVSVTLDASGHATAIRHHTRGCAICAASADLMAERAEGQDEAEAQVLFDRFERLLQQGQTMLDAGDRKALGLLLAFADLHEYRSRRKCATLPWSALLGAFQSRKDQTIAQ